MCHHYNIHIHVIASVILRCWTFSTLECRSILFQPVYWCIAYKAIIYTIIIVFCQELKTIMVKMGLLSEYQKNWGIATLKYIYWAYRMTSVILFGLVSLCCLHNLWPNFVNKMCNVDNLEINSLNELRSRCMNLFSK